MSRNVGGKALELPLLLKQQARILFGLSARQVLIVTVGLAVSYSLWQMASIDIWLLVVLCSVSMSLALILAFATWQARPLEEWLFILLLWALMPDYLTRIGQLLRFFVKVRLVKDDIVALDAGSGGKGYLAYQAILRVEAVQDFGLMSEEEQALTIEAFRRVLDGLSYPITIQIRSLSYTPAVLATTLVDRHLAKALRRFYAHYLAYLSQLVTQRLPVRTAYYLTIPAEKDEKGEKDFERAKTQIGHRIREISRQLARANIQVHQLSSRELFIFYLRGLSLQQTEDVEIDDPDVLTDTNQLPVVLAPRSVSIGASRLIVERTNQRREYLACLVLSQLPRAVNAGWLHSIIQMNEPHVEISVHVDPQETDLMTRHLRRKAVELRGVLLAAEKRGEHGGNTITRHALKDVEQVRDQLMRKESHLHALTLVWLVRALSRDELDARVKRVQLAVRSLDFQASLLHYQHHLGYYSSLGYGQHVLRGYSHLLPTEAAASFYPFSSSPTMESGTLLGATPNGNLISLDLEREQLNANVAVLGVPGSGKSFFLKVMLSRLAPSNSISVIDLEGEYARWAEAVGGHQIHLTADSFHINPLELSSASGEVNSFREKVAVLLGFFALLIGENGALTRHEQTLLRESLMRAYAERGITNDPATHRRTAPTVHDVALSLRKQAGAVDLGERLAAYLHLFPRKTEIPDYPHIVYSLRQLPEALWPAAMYLLTEKLWQALRENQDTHPRHLVVIDEAWFLSKFSYGAVLLNELARRIRKYHGALWVGTQQMEDMLSSEQGKNLLSLCATKLLFRQDASSIAQVQHSLHLSSAQVRFIQTARAGEALYLTTNDTLTIDVLASEREEAMARTSAAKEERGAVGAR